MSIRKPRKRAAGADWRGASRGERILALAPGRSGGCKSAKEPPNDGRAGRGNEIAPTVIPDLGLAEIYNSLLQCRNNGYTVAASFARILCSGSSRLQPGMALLAAQRSVARAHAGLAHATHHEGRSASCATLVA